MHTGIFRMMPASVRRQRGQAIAETIIACAFLLVPLFLIMTLLMRYISMDVAAQQAARYAAFQRTVYMPSSSLRGATAATRSQAQIQTDAQVRFFGDPTGICSQNGGLCSTAYQAQPLWEDASGQELVGQNSGTLGTLSNAASGTLQDGLIGGIFSALNVVGIGFDLDTSGLTTAQVSLVPNDPNGAIGYDNLASPSTLYNHLGLTFNAQDALLADGWSAANPGNVRHQISSVLPTSLFSPLNSVISATNVSLGGNGYGLLPDLSGLTLGYVLVNDPAEVPADRLANYNPPPNTGGNGSAQAQQLQTLTTIYVNQLGYTCSQSAPAGNGVITLTCSIGSTTTTIDVYPSGCTTPPQSSTTQTAGESVMTLTQDQINSLGSKGFSVSSGPSYTCVETNGTTVTNCDTSQLGNNQSALYQATVTASQTSLTQTTSYGSGLSSSVTGSLSVTGNNSSSTATFVTSSSASSGATCSG